ncbi:hypothetical protein M0R88_02580 [Halorussus gelatinilyticus]|uniref:Uncharacterized protein n=1 Tax=Halorussus gelatinilyticus TaxID=2937524 RepID=A0A8U0IJZ6_9EURY|nr:hypothetical protein [Halorussus gelatinilyticus]UPW00995.1 hypothetical protein M0R88_02580 [Halorussus gelatinilyticus]
MLTKITDRYSFDRISLLSAVILVAAMLLFIYIFKIELRVAVTFIAAFFTLLSVRESKRNREVDVAPTLFVGIDSDGKYGILNLGNGPAHELSVDATTEKEDVELEGEVLCVDGFLPLKTDARPKTVEMEYRSNVGKKYDDVTRKVPSDEG